MNSWQAVTRRCLRRKQRRTRTGSAALVGPQI